MTSRVHHEIRLHVEPGIILGPRLTTEIRLRIRQLESRHTDALTRADKGELQKLKDLLQQSGGRNVR